MKRYGEVDWTRCRVRTQLQLIGERRGSMPRWIDHRDGNGKLSCPQPIDNVAVVKRQRTESARRRQRAYELVAREANS